MFIFNGVLLSNFFWIIVTPWIVAAFAVSLSTFLNSLISVDTFVFCCLLGFVLTLEVFHVCYLIIPASIFFVVDISLGLLSLTRLVGSSSNCYIGTAW